MLALTDHEPLALASRKGPQAAPVIAMLRGDGAAAGD